LGSDIRIDLSFRLLGQVFQKRELIGADTFLHVAHDFFRTWVAPGHELWRKYKSIQNWVLDLNRLLERRYSDKTLEQMCGVYVQPCNQNWLLATSQIFDELKAQNIE
jgi:hypothetical protein